MDIAWEILVAALGVGFLLGLTGVGAGALMTPLLIAVFRVPIATAVATDLLFATVTKVAGVAVHNRVGNVNWKTVRKLWVGSVPGVVVGIGALVIFADSSFASWLTIPLVLVVLLTAFVLARRAFSPSFDDHIVPEQPHDNAARGRWSGPAGGFGIGFAVALTSVGAGALGMALLVKLSPPRTRPQELVGTDLVHAIPIALIAGIAYGVAGFVSWELLATLLAGSIPGVLVGSLLSDKVRTRPMNGVLAGILVVAALLVLGK